MCVCVCDTACFCSVNVCVFRQSRAVLHMVTLHCSPPAPSPHTPSYRLHPISKCLLRSLPLPSYLLFFFFFTLPLFLSLVSHMLSYSWQAIPVLTATIYLNISPRQLFRFKGRQGHPFCVLPCSVPQGCALHMCCLSCRSLLCAGGPFPPPEEARLLPHTDLHPSHNGCCAVASVFLDQ